MEATLIGLTGAASFLTGSTAITDVAGEEDDTHVGFQVSMPLDAERFKFMSDRNEYNAGEIVSGFVIGMATVARSADRAADEAREYIDPEADGETIAGC